MKRFWLFILLYLITASIQSQNLNLDNPAINDALPQDALPWWRTIWGYVACFVAALIPVLLLLRFKINRIRSETRRLLEKKEAERLAEINRMKNDFFATITQEFHSQLTLIMESLRQVMPQLEDPELREKVELAEKNSRHLLILINRLTDFDKLESRTTAPEQNTPFLTPVSAVKESGFPHVEGGEPLVLIIEDSEDLRIYIRESLSDYYLIAEAANGEEGVEKALEWIPDIIISDLMMPGKDGLAVCEELKSNELTAHIPIILLTGKTTLDSKLQGLHAGADDYLTKPFYTEELLARMANLIENRRLMQARFSKSRPNTEKTTDKTEEASFSKADQEFLQKINALLEDRLDDENLSVEDVAGLLYVSRVQLHRKLKALTGHPANEFIRNYRLDRALEMLKNQEGNVSQIAARTGFKNQKYFSVRFKERFGISPSEV
jgi:DNA-binding response OmpR family regulator